MQDISIKLCQLRDLTGLSQFQLASLLGISQPAYCHWEKGRFTPKWKYLSMIASFYQIPVSELLYGGVEPLVTQVFHNKALILTRSNKAVW